MLSTFLPFYLIKLVSKFRGVFGGRKLFLPGHFGLIYDGRVEVSIGVWPWEGRNTFLPFPEEWGRYAPVTAAVALTLDRVDRSR